ncbi:rifin PIR protein, putative [Plasmodium reichenowi]|uniref:Rifin PIR protein, putative n=1 Tax=Plasmodium reichenowi TaxID=5854 RepID=A0A2P9DS90_PLARE|nr:rifin PIR protein, putative [Plasmodium reichenowi]
MKVHYINILLFSLPLNILAHNNNKPHTTPCNTHTNRSLCECELYAPANYDSDPEMKKAMQQFQDRTTQRFHEYDERLQEKRMQCKEQCDKEIQKIILKDKLEKELMDKFATLQTDIHSDAIPTCVCEKSMADKVEKECLRCGGVLGGGVAPSVGLLGGMGIYVWKPKALEATIAAALKLYAGKISTVAEAAGKIAEEAKGVEIVIKFLEEYSVDKFCPDLLQSIGSKISYTNYGEIAKAIYEKYETACSASLTVKDGMCTNVGTKFELIGNTMKFGPPRPVITGKVMDVVGEATSSAKAAAKAKVAATKGSMEAAVETAQEKAIEAATYNWYATIGYSVLAILIIVLIMVIIYKILRYRRKKKMKKKLQYIKLLEE